jgi:hypothetical protein
MARRDRRGGMRLGGRWVTWRNLGAWAAMLTVAAALICGVVGLFTHKILWEVAILGGLSTGLIYIVATTRESNDTFAELANSIGKLTSIPEPDHVFRHTSYTLEDQHGKGGWRKVRIYAPVGVWKDSEPKDLWLKNLVDALNRNEVGQCWGFYGLPPRSDARAFYIHAAPRLSLFLEAENCELHYIPPEDVKHPGGAPGLGVVVFQGYGETPDYKTVFLYMGDGPKARGGFMIEDRSVGQTVASWFDSQVFQGCSVGYVLRPDSDCGGISPAQFMKAKLDRIGHDYYGDPPPME